jgi:AraC-like DNA-binding protein
MTSLNPSIGNSSVLALVSLLEDYGFERSLIANLSGVNLRELDQQDGRLSLPNYQKLWATALDITKNPALGLDLGQQVDTSKVGIVGHIIFNSANLQEGIQEYVRLFSLVNEAISLSFETDENLGYLQFVHTYPEYYCIPDMERSMVLLLYRAKALFNENIVWQSVDFQHAEPIYVEQYHRIFGCTVRFNQPVCQITFKKKYLQLKPKKRNPFIGRAALQYANNLLKKLFKRTWADKVKTLIAQSLSQGEADIDHIANKLNTSRQTLYRKLKTEDASFQTLLEEVRFSLAKNQLKNSALSLSEIAFSLGFSDLSAFSRAFKRWSGVSPKDFREKHTKG